VPVIIFCVLSSMSVFRVGIESGGTEFLSQSIRVKRWLTPFVIYFLFVNTARNPQGVKYLVVTLATCVTAIAILTMKESYDIGPGGTWDAIRVRGVLGQANATGAFFVYYTLIFLGFFLCHWRDKRYWLLLIPFLMCGRAMTLANSRGGLIAFTLALLLTLWFRAKSLFVLGVLLVGLGLAFPQYLPETISGRLIYGTFQPLPHSDVISPDGEEFTDSEKSILHQMDASSQGRLAIWKAGFQLFLERPWFGHGYGEFPRRVGKYNPNVRMRDPHNTFLGIASEMGIFALMAFVVTLLLILRACHHVYHHARDGFMRSVGLAGVGMVMGVASANFFGSRLDTTELMAYFWILSAIILQYDRDLRAERRENGELTNRLVLDPWREQEENPAEPN